MFGHFGKSAVNCRSIKPGREVYFGMAVGLAGERKPSHQIGYGRWLATNELLLRTLTRSPG